MLLELRQRIRDAKQACHCAILKLEPAAEPGA
jgi:hypothetical protein